MSSCSPHLSVCLAPTTRSSKQWPTWPWSRICWTRRKLWWPKDIFPTSWRSSASVNVKGGQGGFTEIFRKCELWRLWLWLDDFWWYLMNVWFLGLNLQKSYVEYCHIAFSLGSFAVWCNLQTCRHHLIPFSASTNMSILMLHSMISLWNLQIHLYSSHIHSYFYSWFSSTFPDISRVFPAEVQPGDEADHGETEVVAPWRLVTTRGLPATGGHSTSEIPSQLGSSTGGQGNCTKGNVYTCLYMFIIFDDE